MLDQSLYIEKVLNRFHMINCNPSPTPEVPGQKLSKDQCPKTEEEKKAALPEDDQAKLTWLEFVNGWGGVAEIDKQDRLMLPRKIRERFNLVNEEVDVTGFQKYLVVRSQKSAEERLTALQTPNSDSEKVMGIEEAKRILAAREAQKS